MNAYATEAYGQSRLSPTTPSPTPSGKSLVQGYRKDIITGFEKEHPRFNPVCAEFPRLARLTSSILSNAASS